MPSREQMVKELEAFHSASAPAKAGSVATPSREQMIRELEQFHASESQEPTSAMDVLEKGTVAARSGLEGMTLGLSEPVISAAIAPLSNALKSYDESSGVGDFIGKAVSPSRISQAYKDDVDLRRQMKADNPITDVASQIGGAILPTVATLGEGALVTAGRMAPTVGRAATVGKALDVGGTVAKGAGKLVGGTVARLGASLSPEASAVARLINNPLTNNALARGVGKIALGAGEGAAAALGSEAVRQGAERSTGFMKEGEGPTLGEAAITGAKFGGTLAAIPQVYGAAKYLGKQAFSTILGPKPEIISEYMANAKRINEAPTVEAIKDELDTFAQKLSDDVDAGKISADEAKAVHKSVQENIRQVKTDSSQEFSRQNYNARKDLDVAEDKFAGAARTEKEKLQAVRAPIDLQGDVGDAIANLKSKVGNGSKEAYAILDSDPNGYSVRGGAKLLRQMADDMNIQPFGENGLATAGSAGVGAPITNETAGVQSQIRALADRLENTPEKVPARELKKILQQLDASGKAMYGQPGFDSRTSQAYKMVRSTIDQAVKDANPAYRAKMIEVADDTGVLDQALDHFGETQTRINKLSSIDRPTAGPSREVLGKLADKTAGEFMPDVEGYIKAKGTLSNPRKMAAITNALPEREAVLTRQREVDRMAHPDAQRSFTQSRLEGSGLLDESSKAERLMAESTEAFDKAKAAREPFKALSKENSQSKIANLMRDPKTQNINTQRLIDLIDAKQGSNLSMKINDRMILETFDKGNTNGSRNVNLFSIMGHAMGKAAGATGVGFALGGPIGAVIGGVTGAVVDKFGPKIAKGILDGILAMKNQPTIAKINSLQLPPNAKRFMIAQLEIHSNAGAQVSGLPKVAEVNELDKDSSRSSQYKETAQPKGRDKWIGDGFDKVKSEVGEDSRDALMSSERGKRLLIQASDLKPGSKAMQKTLSDIRAELKKGKN